MNLQCHTGIASVLRHIPGQKGKRAASWILRWIGKSWFTCQTSKLDFFLLNLLWWCFNQGICLANSLIFVDSRIWGGALGFFDLTMTGETKGWMSWWCGLPQLPWVFLDQGGMEMLRVQCWPVGHPLLSFSVAVNNVSEIYSGDSTKAKISSFRHGTPSVFLKSTTFETCPKIAVWILYFKILLICEANETLWKLHNKMPGKNSTASRADWMASAQQRLTGNGARLCVFMSFLYCNHIIFLYI